MDAADNAYVTGNTYSSNFPTTSGPFQPANGDAFVTKVNPLGTGLVYSTYLGGNNYDFGLGIAVDAAGNAYVTGYTYSTNFPTTTGAHQTTSQGDRDAFVTKVNPLGTGLVYSTYLGGSNYDFGYGIAVDAAGNAYVTGNTSSINFPTTTGAYQTASGGSFDAFVTKLNPLGAGLVYSTYLGGSNADEGQGIAVDAAGNAYVTGFTLSSNFPTTTGAYQTTNQGDRDAFVMKVNPLGTGLLYSTYLGGSGYDQGLGIAVDTAGNAYVTGDTYSSNFPATAGAYQTTNHGTENAFVTKFGGFPNFNQPPIASAGVSYSGNEGAAIAMSSATASDPDSDTLTYSWSISNTTLCSFSNAGVLNPNLTCSDNGAFNATLTVNDAHNPAVTSNASVTVNNVRPSATFGNNGPVNEGSSINLYLTSPSDPSLVDTTTGFKYAFDCGSGYGALTPVSTAACATNDNGTRVLKGKIQDKDGGFTEYTATVTVNNIAPTVTVTGPASGSIYPVGTPVTFAGTFTDPGLLDTHTAQWKFDALTAAGVVTESGGNGSVSGTYTFTIPGVYQVTLAVTDKDNGAGAASMIGALTAMVVIYDPNGGFVTGGGWIDSPIGAYIANPSLVGKANFGLVSKYQKGATVPAGETEFQFKIANFNFHSTSYNWLVIAGARAQYKGSGTINGIGNYAFLLTAIDGQVSGGGGVDKFRIKIWDKTTSAVIYDNQMGQSDDSNATTALGGGSIVIRQ